MVLSAVYMLWLFQRVFTGPITRTENSHMPDLVLREKFVLGTLVVLVFWFGCYVTTWTRYLTGPTNELVKTVLPGESTAPPPIITAERPQSAEVAPHD
jgi:NADH-quinone oxidoreductase subunit M